MHLADEDLPSEIKGRLAQMTASHNFEKFWEHMRRNHDSERPAMTEEQRRRRPPVIHPVFLTHPITGRKVLYCNPGYAVRMNELPERASEEMLEFLFAAPAADEILLHQCLDRERRFAMGPLRHDTSRHRRLQA